MVIFHSCVSLPEGIPWVFSIVDHCGTHWLLLPCPKKCLVSKPVWGHALCWSLGRISCPFHVLRSKSWSGPHCHKVFLPRISNIHLGLACLAITPKFAMLVGKMKMIGFLVNHVQTKHIWESTLKHQTLRTSFQCSHFPLAVPFSPYAVDNKQVFILEQFPNLLCI